MGSYPTRGPAISGKFAILIDAGFLKRKLGSPVHSLDAQGVAAFIEIVLAHAALAGMRLHRVYWYDAPPLTVRVPKPLLGGEVNFAATRLARSSSKLLDELRLLPLVSIRRGDLAFRGWKVRRGKLPLRKPSVALCASDIEPNVHQKGVDMRLGLDIAALTLKSHVGAIVLVTGDSDFVPAMKFARREGVQVLLASLGHPVRGDMLEHADILLNLPIMSPTPKPANAA